MKEEQSTNGGRLIFGVLLILLGVGFFLQRYLAIDLGRYGWPFFIIGPGALIYLASLILPEEPGKGLSAVGSIITMVGLILFYQNTFDHFESWAYAWALVAPTSLGLGWIGYGLLHGNGDLAREGIRLAGTGLLIFLVAGAFFELVIGLGGYRLAWADTLWPVLLILAGVLLLARGFWAGSRKKGA